VTPKHLQIAAWIGVILAIVQIIPFLTGKPKLSDFFFGPPKPDLQPRFEEPVKAKSRPTEQPLQPTPAVTERSTITPRPQGTPVPTTPELRAKPLPMPDVASKPPPQPGTPQPSPTPNNFKPAEKKKVQSQFLGKVSATIEFAKLSERGRLEVPVAFTNTGSETCWIIPAEGAVAQASDNAKGTYDWSGAKGFFRSPLARARGLSSSSHKFLQLDPNIPAIGILQFGRDYDPSFRKTLTPTNVRITARFTIVDSLKSFASHDHALSATVDLN
jgi:hypothetical protein